MQRRLGSVMRVSRLTVGLTEQARWPLWALALLVLALVAIRASIQSITIDEGDTYVYWVSGEIFEPWHPHSNNLLLNTYLIWIFVHLFGLNNISMRLPSFIGALLYLSAVYRFCISFVDRFSLRLPLFACMIANPFVLDFFVAARGYSLALGFLTTAIAILFVGSVYFIGCLRLHYFLQWRFDADIEETYRKLVQTVGPGHHAEIPCQFLYASALNYYREYFHDDSFGSFSLSDNPKSAVNTHYRPYPLKQPVYVLMSPQDDEFTAEQHLKVTYKGPVSGVVIAVEPGLRLSAARAK